MPRASAIAAGVLLQTRVGVRNAVRQARRVGVDDGVQQPGRAVEHRLGGMTPGQQHVEQHAQGVDVGRGRDLALAHLLRRGVGRRQQRVAGARQAGAERMVVVALEQPGDAEIQQLHLSGGA